MKKILIYIGIILLIIGSLITVLIFNKNNINESVIYIESINEVSTKSGSGFIYKVNNNKNYIVTSYHVIEGYKEIYIYNKDKKKIKADVLNYDEYTDIAILTIKNELNLKKINIGNSDKIKVNDLIYVVGTPLDISNFNTKAIGAISFVNKEIIVTTKSGSSILNTIQVTAKVDNGNSGGPLLNKDNEVIGMMFVKDDGYDRVSFALPINFVMDIVNKLENNELQRPNLGAVMCNSTNQELLNQYGISYVDINGVVLLEVNRLSNELQKGDIITKFDNKDINNVVELRSELYKKNVGDSVRIEYYRNGNYYKANIKL